MPVVLVISSAGLSENGKLSHLNSACNAKACYYTRHISQWQALTANLVYVILMLLVMSPGLTANSKLSLLI